uniref:C-type lectin domain-containing protein n=1 Tax=Xiphophorus maculatus TaxID=8083 RepID=A0A3B5R2F7_XIPMA
MTVCFCTLPCFFIPALLLSVFGLWTNTEKRRTKEKITTHTDRLRECREGWREYESKCYFFSTDTKTWTEANAYCIEQGSNLMSIQDIQERVRGFNTHDCKIFWIGLNDLVIEGVWEWSDGKPFIEYLSYVYTASRFEILFAERSRKHYSCLFRYWMSGQPDNFNEMEHCGEVVGYDFGHWNDDNCSNKRKYICKYINGKKT